MIVIPARNEGPRVGAVVRAARAAVPDMDIVVVANASTDDTAEQARRAGAIVLTSTAPGYARALRLGFDLALARGASRVVQMDADGQHPAEAVPGLLEALERADVVVGSRFVAPVGYVMPPLRRAAVRALGAWATVCAGAPLRDVTSGLRAWRAPALAAMLPDFPTDVADANLLVRAVRRGYRVAEVPVAMRARSGGRSQHGGPASVMFAARMVALTAREAWATGPLRELRG